MNQLTSLILLVSFMSIMWACDKETEITENTEVIQYIEQLADNKYDSKYLPEFTSKDIPALLLYRNEETIVEKYPRNPLSSYFKQQCKIGVLVLWTIESIRLSTSQNIKSNIDRFPSLNPILNIKNPQDGYELTPEDAHEEAAQAYFEWWQTYEDKPIDRIFNNSPLSDTNLSWQ